MALIQAKPGNGDFPIEISPHANKSNQGQDVPLKDTDVQSQ
jgi:hypothetical protein